MELLDCLVRAVVGRKVYIDSRMTKPLSEWFTLTDEAFLLLCLESYVPKWNREWAQSSCAPVAAAARQQEEGEQTVGDEDALYTGKSRGTKRSWSKDGLERFNGLMIDVYRDRQANGANFDNIFREEMIKRYGKQNDTTNPVRGEDEQTNPENRVVVVYSDFNMEHLMAHATAASSVGAGREASRGQQGNEDDDDADEVSRVMV